MWNCLGTVIRRCCKMKKGEEPVNIETLCDAYTQAGGGLTGEALQGAALLSWGYLLSGTLGRISVQETVTPAILQCFTALTELVAGKSQGGELQAQTLGDWRVEYRDAAGGKTLDQQASALIRRYLGDTDLLYRGWGPC